MGKIFLVFCVLILPEVMGLCPGPGLTPAVAQTSAKEVVGTVNETVDQRLDTQQKLDEWDDEESDLVRRYRAATATIEWLQGRKDTAEAEAAALDASVAELTRRLEEADRLESSVQDTLSVVLGRLETSVNESVPFLPEERSLRLESVREELTRPGVSAAEKLRRLLEALQVEAGYATTVEVYQDQVEVEGIKLHLDVLRLGRLSLFWQTPDGKRVGVYDQASATWRELPSSYKRNISMAMEMATRMRPVELINLPLGRIGQ